MTEQMMKDFLNIQEFNHFAFPLTNSCNLSCDCCSVHADLPIDKNSIYPERRKLYRMKLPELKKYVEALDGVGTVDWHRLTGGEPTLYLDDCIDAINYLYDSGRKKICLATNGLHLMDLPIDVLNKVQWMELDYHAVNSELIHRCKKHLKQHYTHRLHLIKYGKHYDLHFARFHELNSWYCGHAMRVVKFRDGIIFPCGHFECLTTFRHDTNIQDLLTAYGWHIDKVKDLPFLLQHWRETIPLDIFKYCLSCWRPNQDLRVFDTMEKHESI